jgi:hypothetical protein
MYRGGTDLTPSVLIHSKRLARLISMVQGRYAGISQSLDSSFPARVLDPKQRVMFDQAELKRKLAELSSRRNTLRSNGRRGL